MTGLIIAQTGCSGKTVSAVSKTGYYFDRMAKGKHVIETEYYVDRAGTYSTGTCTVQCAYSPEYSARSAAMTVNVSERK